jgi:hypothetical protein
MPRSRTPVERPTRCCTGPLLQAARGRPRFYCSDRCRKLQNARQCLDCGKTINLDGARTNPSILCVTCRGRYQREQSRAWILRSISEWVDLYGTPPSATDWNPPLARKSGMAWKADRYEQAGHRWPSTTLCRNIFGSWNNALQAAGYPPVQPGEYRDGRSVRDIDHPARPVHWTPERCLDAGARWASEHGQPPISSDWRVIKPGYPTINTIRERFGTWRAYRAILDQHLEDDQP